MIRSHFRKNKKHSGKRLFATFSAMRDGMRRQRIMVPSASGGTPSIRVRGWGHRQKKRQSAGEWSLTIPLLVRLPDSTIESIDEGVHVFQDVVELRVAIEDFDFCFPTGHVRIFAFPDDIG